MWCLGVVEYRDVVQLDEYGAALRVVATDLVLLVANTVLAVISRNVAKVADRAMLSVSWSAAFSTECGLTKEQNIPLTAGALSFVLPLLRQTQ